MKFNSRRGLYVGRYFGIEFYLHYSWFLIAALITYVLTNEIFASFGQVIAFALGISAAALFFFCLLLHELGHSLVSQRCGIPVPRITLLFIGGLAEIAREPDDARSELKIALGGPIVTFVLVFIFAGLEFLFSSTGWRGLASMCDWLWKTNLGLLIFNMFPGYPLDGGRVLRALLWARSGRLRRATYIASRVGIGFAWLLVALGVYLMVVEHVWNAVIFFLIGMFLRNAAEGGYVNAIQRELLAGVRVRDFMTPDPATIGDSVPLNLAVDDHFLVSHHKAFPICASDGEFRGLLRFDHIKGVPRERRPYVTTGDLVAEVGAQDLWIGADQPAARAMRLLLAPGTSRLAVVENGKVVGIVTRRDISRFIEVHTEFEE